MPSIFDCLRVFACGYIEDYWLIDATAYAASTIRFRLRQLYAGRITYTFDALFNMMLSLISGILCAGAGCVFAKMSNTIIARMPKAFRLIDRMMPRLSGR